MAEIDGDRLSNQEIFFICWQLLTAGHETTTSLICSCVKLLTDHPDQRAKLLADPGLLEQAIEEVLRFESPAQAMPRRVTQDTEIAGTTLPAGSILTVMFGAANRDAEKWPDPDRFDITRPLNEVRRHLAFGFGVHACLGSNLARLEARIALGKLLARVPDIAVDGACERELSHFTRAWTRMPVRWSSPPA
jgi:cytochrome P450